ncbi:hypothetical protein FKP32DRAFT_1602951 [Trametes sanguinea]|nr:hypothetical protein FKP32DRAFT_1602951 [Trametes sanguinea]
MLDILSVTDTAEDDAKSLPSPPASSGLPESSIYGLEAPYPFNRVDADLILRSCDDIAFRVRSHIILEASPVLRDKIARATAGASPAPSPLSIDLAEDSKTIETLLRICYPILNPPLDDPLPVLEKILKAAMEYDMEFPIAVLSAELLSRAAHAPLAVWALGCRAGLEPLARGAAEHTFAATDLRCERDSDLEGCSAWQLFQLREFWRSKGHVGGSFSFLTPDSAGSVSPRFDGSANRIFFPPSVDNSDLTILSSNRREYKAHQDVISMVSPVLKEKIADITQDMASTSSYRGVPTKKGKKGVKIMPAVPTPTLRVEEDDNTIVALLDLCYHRGNNIPARGPFRIAPILSAVYRYQMLSLLPTLRSQWIEVSAAQPLRAYLAAANAALHAEASESAQLVLKHGLDGMFADELRTTPALPYYRLMVYYDRCRAIARERFFALRLARPVGGRVGPAENGEGDNAIGEQPEAAYESEDWFARRVDELSELADRHPGHLAPSPGSLYEDATRAKQWCARCQDLADRLFACMQTLQEIEKSISAEQFTL